MERSRSVPGARSRYTGLEGGGVMSSRQTMQPNQSKNGSCSGSLVEKYVLSGLNGSTARYIVFLAARTGPVRPGSARARWPRARKAILWYNRSPETEKQ